MAAKRRARSWVYLSSGQRSRSRGSRSLMCSLRWPGWVMIHRAASRGESGISLRAARPGASPAAGARRPFSRAGNGRSSPCPGAPYGESSRCVAPRPRADASRRGKGPGRRACKGAGASLLARCGPGAYLATVRRSRPSSRAMELWLRSGWVERARPRTACGHAARPGC